MNGTFDGNVGFTDSSESLDLAQQSNPFDATLLLSENINTNNTQTAADLPNIELVQHSESEGIIPDINEESFARMFSDRPLNFNSESGSLLALGVRDAFERGGEEGIQELFDGINSLLEPTGRQFEVTRNLQFEEQNNLALSLGVRLLDGKGNSLGTGLSVNLNDRSIEI